MAAQQGAKSFARARGRKYQSPDPQLQQDPRVGFAIQREYRQNEPIPTGHRIQDSYKAMSRDIGDQYRFMTAPQKEGGLGIRHEVTNEDPYSTAAEMAHDVHHNGRIRTMSTETTGGHAFFSNETNDQFRAVHDVFGHAAIGRGFSRHGEEAAWRGHRQMFSPEAREAMTSETRGQNSYLNFSPQGGFPDQTKNLVRMSRLARSPRANVRLEERPRRPAADASTQLPLF